MPLVISVPDLPIRLALSVSHDWVTLNISLGRDWVMRNSSRLLQGHKEHCRGGFLDGTTAERLSRGMSKMIIGVVRRHQAPIVVLGMLNARAC